MIPKHGKVLGSIRGPSVPTLQLTEFSANCLTKLVGRAGVEPATNGLKVVGSEKTSNLHNTQQQYNQAVSCSSSFPLSQGFCVSVSRQCPASPPRYASESMLVRAPHRGEGR